MKQVIEIWKTFEILRPYMFVLLCSDTLILFTPSSQGSCTWKKLLITVNTLTDLIVLCPFPAEESSCFWEKLHKTELNEPCCDSQGICHLPGCEAQLKQEQRAPKGGWEAPSVWIEPGNNSHIKCAKGPKLWCQSTNSLCVLLHLHQGDFHGHPDRSRDVSALLFQSASRIPHSLKRKEGKFCRGGKNETVLGITLTRKDFFLNVVLVNEVKWLADHSAMNLDV